MSGRPGADRRESSALATALRELLPHALRGGSLDHIGCRGFLSKDGLRRMLRALRDNSSALPHGLPLIEVGGGDSRLAVYLGARLQRPAISTDRERFAMPADDRKADWQVRADLHRLPFADAAAGILLAHDVFHLAGNPTVALRECRRVLRPGGALYFTTYTAQGQVPGGSVLPADWRPLLQNSGFVDYQLLNKSHEWRRIMRIKHGVRLQHADTLLARFGPNALPDLSVSMAMIGLRGPAFLDLVERWEIAAVAPENGLEKPSAGI